MEGSRPWYHFLPSSSLFSSPLSDLSLCSSNALRITGYYKFSLFVRFIGIIILSPLLHDQPPVEVNAEFLNMPVDTRLRSIVILMPRLILEMALGIYKIKPTSYSIIQWENCSQRKRRRVLLVWSDGDNKKETQANGQSRDKKWSSEVS